ncbi:SIS domain-containing protein [Anaeromicrobium sediminis]|uniref:SIS domain-containing protein n=1 Tax=Anaeromicrobium sediminis TaxID=1478221 RepID=A0A267MHU3_9FIRM|nr:SIS domain-containing protein [Anaeromicrobium sediminis]PAB59154.1 hypothetical protein CCE28_11590 [Anaeromicrobium sediminis]
MYYKKYTNQLYSVLNNLIITDLQGRKLDLEKGFNQWCEITRFVRKFNKTFYLIGNGASAMMASHMAADVSKNGNIRSIAFNDPAMLTAISNDISYEQSFALPLKRFANSEDVLVTISSSGNSPNIIAAINKAREIGLKVITLSGMKPTNNSRKLGDLNFYIPAETYGLVEIAHQMLLHCWLDKYMEEM